MQSLQEAAELQPLRVWEGVSVRVLHGERLSVAIAELAPGTVVPEHRHENEQLGVVVDGSATFITGDERLELRAGGMYRFLANVPHQVEVGPEGAVFVESFSPIRSDWDALSPETEVPPRWPRGA
jgi:quercetin dioxygenase-like cupin family protein